jgi:hypothetical protein
MLRPLRSLSFSLVSFVLLLFVAALTLPVPASAYLDSTGYLPIFGDLVKLQNDHDSATTADEAVYYIDSDLLRRAFPNRKVYDSWYAGFLGIKEITLEEMSRIRLAGNITYRPGTRLVKIPSVPRVYAVEPNGSLRWLETEAVARELYGSDWAQRVDDMSEALFADYVETVPLTANVWPTGTVVSRSSDSALFFIEGSGKRHIMPDVRYNFRIQDRNVITADEATLSKYDDLSPLSSADTKYTDTGESYFVGTLSPPTLDFPAAPEANRPAGEDASLYILRLTVGEPVTVRGLSVRLSGNLWLNGQPLISDLRFEDSRGVNLFGTKQMESSVGSTEETVTLAGAYTMESNTIEMLHLKGKLSADAPENTVITANFVESGLILANGWNGDLLTRYWVSTAFPEYQVVVK